MTTATLARAAKAALLLSVLAGVLAQVGSAGSADLWAVSSNPVGRLYDDTLRPLPGGLRIAVKLRSRISSDMAVGTLIDGVVAGNVAAKKARC